MQSQNPAINTHLNSKNGIIDCVNLDLRNNANALADVLKKHTTYQTIKINVCKIGKGVSASIFQQIEACSIASLEIVGNELLDEVDFCNELAEFLKKNTSVESITLKNNIINVDGDAISEASVNTIIAGLQMNKSVRNIDVGRLKLTDKQKKEIQEISTNNVASIKSAVDGATTEGKDVEGIISGFLIPTKRENDKSSLRSNSICNSFPSGQSNPIPIPRKKSSNTEIILGSPPKSCYLPYQFKI